MKCTGTMVARLVVFAVIAAFVGVSATQAQTAAASCGTGSLSEAQLDAAFAGPGLGATGLVQGFGGGDYPHAYPLPDGRVLWMFQDLHFSNDDNLRNDNPTDIARGTATNAAHNAGLVQQGQCFTMLGGRGRDLIGDASTVDSKTWFWPLDGEIGADGNLWVFMVEMHNPAGTGAGYGALPVRTWLAALNPATFEQLYFQPAADQSSRLYGWSVASTDQWSYLYSHCYRQYANNTHSLGQFDASCMPHTYLARVPRGDFLATPQYWSGSAWTFDGGAATPIASRNVANPMNVQWFGDMFVSVTKENEWWGSRLRVDTAPAAQGPWTEVAARNMVGAMKCSQCGNYGAALLPWLNGNGAMTVALSSGGDFNLWRDNASIYRPTFHTFNLPSAPAGAAPSSPPAFTAGAGTSGFLAVDPVRLADTRQLVRPFTTLAAGVRAELDVSALMPAGATAVALNLTTVSAHDGWVRAFPCAVAEPETSNVNPKAGRAVTNAAVVPVGDGRICFVSESATELIVDLNGWLTSTSAAGLVPATERLVDTRSAIGGLTRLGAGATFEVQVASGSSTTAVALAVTAVDPSSDGYMTLWPCGTPQPTVSNLNPEAGTTRPNMVNVRVGAGGRVCGYTYGETDLIVDLAGEYRVGAGARYSSVAPQRLLDSRTQGHPYHQSNLADVVPFGAVVAAQVNVTVTETVGYGYLTVYSCMSRSIPGTSNANFASAGDTTASAAIVSVSHGYGCMATSSAAEMIVDVVGVWK